MRRILLSLLFAGALFAQMVRAAAAEAEQALLVLAVEAGQLLLRSLILRNHYLPLLIPDLPR
jgi:hypothetical protein